MAHGAWRIGCGEVLYTLLYALCALLGFIQMAQDIFADDNPHIDNGADGDDDPGERDDVGLYAEKFHGDEAK